MAKIKKNCKTAEKLNALLGVVLKISTNDYRIVLDDRNGGMIDVYFRDDRPGEIYGRADVAAAFQTLELFAPEGWRIACHSCTSKHEQFDGRRGA